MQRFRRPLAAAVLLILALPATTLANEPVLGHADLFHHDPGDARITLNYHFGGTYSSWFATTVNDELEVRWDYRPTDLTADQQNSNIPKYNYVASSNGRVIYTDTGNDGSPCSGGLDWLGCNPVGGTTSFILYFRVVPSDTAPRYMWYDKAGNCTDVAGDGFPTDTCFSLYRSVNHEAEHNTLTRSHDDRYALGNHDTIMPSIQAWYGKSYWNYKTAFRCDQAGALLEYGVLDPTRRYPDCFATTPGDGAKGLNTYLSVLSTAYSACLADPSVTVAGRLALASYTRYEDMANTPLAGRVISVYRKASTASTYPTTATYTITAGDTDSGTNWSRTFTSTTTGTWDYKAVWNTTTAETALNTSNTVYWSIKWVTSPCPLIATQP